MPSSVPHPETGRNRAAALDDFAQERCWVAWRQEYRPDKQGNQKLTKVPYAASGRLASTTDPETWATRADAERRWQRIRAGAINDVGGVGIVLGELADGSHLAGIDLDSCINKTNNIEAWACEIIDALASYAEISPSRRGIKMFFIVAAADVAEVKMLLGRKLGAGFKAGEHKGIEIYIGSRYFTVTDDIVDDATPETLRTVSIDEMRWLLQEAVPAFRAKYTKQNEKASAANGRDESNSGHGRRFFEERKREGDNYEQALAALLDDPGRAGDWARKWAGQQGADRQFRRAWEMARSPHAANEEADEVLDVVRVTDVPMKPVEWVWPSVLARGKVTIIAGDPGVGKSQISCFAAGRVTNKSKWPDQARAPSGSAIILSAEDSVDDTIHPRLVATQADVKRVRVIKAVSSLDKQKRRTFDLQRDLGRLERLIAQIGDVILVIIDPASSYMGSGIEGNTMTSVRPVLESIADMAERTRVAVLLIHHPPKHTAGKALHSFSGSLAFVAAPRISFIAVKEEDTERRLLLAVKNTLGPLAGGICYYVVERYVGDPEIKTSCIEWDAEPVNVTANEAVRNGGSQAQPSKLERAQDLLRVQLADGPMQASELIELARVAGIGERTLREAKDLLGVKSRRVGFQGGGEWYLPSEGER